MITTTNFAKVRSLIRVQKAKGKLVGFIPTMGALHAGHLSLVRQGRCECDFLVVSIFVNPLQFGPKEDYHKYPRQLWKDKKLLKEAGVDLVFCPQAKNMYYENHSVYVNEVILSSVLCGKSRPGHFQGVCTVVAKLFNIIQPDVAYFGQKDYQQALIIKRMVRDLNFPIKVKVLPIVREKDKLALSSRNLYLSPSERQESLCLYEALSLARNLIESGQTNSEKVIAAMRRLICLKKSAKIDYIEILGPYSLKKVKKIKGKVLIVLAVFIGKTRLIDNIIVDAKN